MEPSPLQVGQVVTVCIWPRKVLLTRRPWPLPPQVEQVWTLFLFLAPLPLRGFRGPFFFFFFLGLFPRVVDGGGFAGHLSVRFFYFLGGGSFRAAQYFVVISFSH